MTHPMGRRVRRRILASAAVLVTCVPVLVATTAADATTGRTVYLDCAAGNDAARGTSPDRAWRTLDKVNSVRFRPGDRIRLKAGVTCAGTLAPHGSGTPDAPIVVEPYPRYGRAGIAAPAARAAVLLHNVDGYELTRLDVANPGGSADTSHIGIYVLLEDFGIGRHYLVDDVRVHDVAGCDCTAPTSELTGGIIFRAGGSTVPTGFTGILVRNSEVSTVDGMGIATSSLWGRRELSPGAPGTEFVPFRQVRIDGNRLSGLGGDGIVVQNGVHALVQRNIVDGFALHGTIFHAGIWTWNSDFTLMQFNEVAHGGGPLPTVAFDADAGNRGLIYQYNYSHDNSGGLILFCADPDQLTVDSTIRYNISQNDTDVAGTALIISVCAAQENVSFYNNVIFSEHAVTLVVNVAGTAIRFANNVFVGGSAGATIFDPTGVYDHNLYHNIGTVPAGDAHAVVAPPGFVAAGTATSRTDAGGYRLACGSPALDAGVQIPRDGGRDYFGNPIARGDTAPHIGAYEGPCLS